MSESAAVGPAGHGSPELDAAGGGTFETKKCPDAHPLRRTRAGKLYQLVWFRFFASFRTEGLKSVENRVPRIDKTHEFAPRVRSFGGG
ncbi:hypothetical protein ACWEKR_22485 [Nocardia sp. NPDC004573]